MLHEVKKVPRVPVNQMVESIVGCKWSLHVLELVRSGTRRPGLMERTTPGLTTKVLNERLKKLMRFGILAKTIYPVVPPHVEYTLTPFGQKFVRLLRNIADLQRELDKRTNHQGTKES